jgi:hypothetical protein
MNDCDFFARFFLIGGNFFLFSIGFGISIGRLSFGFCSISDACSKISFFSCEIGIMFCSQFSRIESM